MCGIFGIVTSKEQVLGPTLIGAAERLTYRGYDSVGAATLSDGKIDLRKDVGKVDAVAATISILSRCAAARHCPIALGHFRRALSGQRPTAPGFGWRHGGSAQWQCRQQS